MYYVVNVVHRIMLCEKSQSQKVMYCNMPFIQHSRNHKTIEMKNRLVASGFKEEWGQEKSKCHSKRVTKGILVVMAIFYIFSVTMSTFWF